MVDFSFKYGKPPGFVKFLQVAVPVHKGVEDFLD